MEVVAVGRRAHALAAPVQAAVVAVAGVVVRAPVFARRQREPRGTGAAQRHAPVVATDEGHQRRRVHRARAEAAGHPSPARADLRPAAVVRGREAPGRVVHPGPAPGLHPGPAAVAVGRPVGHGDLRVPHGAVGGVLRPFAVGVELLVAGHVARHVAGRGRAVFQRIALGHPLVETVAHGYAAALQRLQVAAGEQRLLALAHGGGLPRLAVHRGHAGVHGDARGVGARIDVHAVFARLAGHHGQVRGVDLDALAGLQLAHAHRGGAVHQRELGGVVVQHGHAQVGMAGQAHGGPTAVQFGARVGVGDEAGAGGHGPVDGGGGKALPVGGDLHGAFGGADVGHARRRIGLGPAQHGRGRQQCAAKPAAPGGRNGLRHGGQRPRGTEAFLPLHNAPARASVCRGRPRCAKLRRSLQAIVRKRFACSWIDSGLRLCSLDFKRKVSEIVCWQAQEAMVFDYF